VEEIQGQAKDLLALLNSGFLREKEVDMWRAAVGDPYPMEKNLDEILMFTWFAERGLSLPASDFFKGLLGYYNIEYLNLNSTVSSTPQSSYTSAKLSWGSSPIGSCFGNSSG
jgi:elongation factor P hydroxylase